LTFDFKGVCSICREYEKYVDEWKSSLHERRNALDKICAKAKNKHKEFDALVPLSGGKDSTFALYVARKELGLNCVAYTLDNGYLSDFARSNIEKACGKLGVEHVYYRFSADLMKRLYSLFVRKTGYPCSVCMRLMAAAMGKMAELYHVPLIISGSSPRTELMGTPEMSEHGLTAHFRSVLEGETIDVEPKKLLSTYSKRRKFGQALFHLTGETHLFTYAWFRLPDYIDWNYQVIEQTIRRELDWNSPEESEHMDCLIHPIQKYIQTRRFPDLSLDRMRFARLIMAGQMTREEALNKLDSTSQCPESELNVFLDDIGMSKEEFDEYIDMGPRHLHYNSPTMLEKLERKARRVLSR
jgi:hypothetical protein